MRTKSIGKALLPMLSALVIILAVFVLLGPIEVSAEGTVYATNLNGEKFYSIGDAWNAAQENGGITMECDWTISERLVLGEGKSAVVCMNNHQIKRTDANGSLFYNGEVICLEEGASLMLYGCDKTLNPNLVYTNFTFDYYDSNANKQSATIEHIGGLITGGYAYRGGAIYMKENATLALENVALAGNRATSFGGGIYIPYSSYVGYCLSMSAGARICYNYSGESGGGIYVNDGNSYPIAMNLSKSTIDHNYAKENGGGICTSHTNTDINLYSGSAISNNTAGHDGGGIWFQGRGSSIDGGTIEYNKAGTDGGGVYANAWTDDGMIIDGTTFNCNTAVGDGGGICASLDGTKIKNCKFTSNKAEDEGGGIYVNGEDSVISSCEFSSNAAATNGGGVYINDEYLILEKSEFTGNTASNEGGAVYNNEDYTTIRDTSITGNSAGKYGGGVFSSSFNNISLTGKVIIKDNKGLYDSDQQEYVNDDDLFLNSFSQTAYVIKAPGEGSEVGIRTDVTGDTRKIGEDAVFSELYFFSDDRNYHIEVNASEEEMYLVKGAKYYVTVNGTKIGAYAVGAEVTIDGTPADSGRAFRQWENDSRSYSAPDYVGELIGTENKYKSVATFSMPEYDVYLKYSFMEKTSALTLEVDKPKAGQAFPATGTLKWKTSEGSSMLRNVPVYWLEQVEDNQTQTVTGTADYGASYSVAVRITQSAPQSLAFTEDVKGTVIYNGDTTDATYGSRLDDSGALIIYGEQVTTAKATVTAVTPVTVTVESNISEDDLKAAMPTEAIVTAIDGKTYTVKLDNGGAVYENAYRDGKLTDGGTVTIPLDLAGTKLEKGESVQNLTVTLTVVEMQVTATPTVKEVEATTTGSVAGKKVYLSCATEGSTIYYKINGSDTGDMIYDDATGIELKGADGEEKTYVITAWASGPENGSYMDSGMMTFTYTVDNPYTITVYARDTMGTQSLPGFPKTYEYHKEEAVKLGAPRMDNVVFESWEYADSLSYITVSAEDGSLNIPAGYLDCSMTVTAVYNPVVTRIELKLDAPVAGENLTKYLTSASATVPAKGEEAIDITDYFNMPFQWDKTAKTADYGTSYTAMLDMLNKDEGKKFVMSDMIDIVVNGGTDTGIKSSIRQINGIYIVYVTFPKTADRPKADPTVTPPTAKTGLTYTGAEQKLIHEGSAVGGQMVYKLDGEAEYSAIAPAGKDEGTYTVWYKVLGDDGYYDTQPQSLLVTIAAAAEPIPDTVTADLSGETAITADQDKLTYQVSLTDAVQAATATVTMNFSGEVAKVSAEGTNGWVAIAQSYENGVLTVVILNYEGMTGSGDILTVTAQTTGRKGSVSAELTGITLSVYAGDREALADTVLGRASVETTIDCSRFDVNMDGIVDQLDITRAQRAFSATAQSAKWNARADVNGDGKVDIGDLILILNNYTKH